MNTFSKFVALFVLAVSVFGCATHKFTSRYEVTYYDLNHDGVIDFEDHDIPAAVDDAWTLRDTDYDGYYDLRTDYGYALERKHVHIPVPRNRPISSVPPPPYILK